jgi:thiol-disulfide isomerase/thioredoxin
MVRSQDFLTGEIQSSPNQYLSIYRMKGEVRYLLDSVVTDNKGVFAYELPKSLQPGMLLLHNNDSKSLKLIYNHEPVQFKIEGFEKLETLVFINSKENTIWREYIDLRNDINLRLNLITPVLDNYPENTKYYKASKKEYNKLKNKLLGFVENINKQYANTFSSKLIRTDFVSPPPIELNQIDRLDYLKDHFLDSINFADTLLLNSDILTKKMIDFLALHQQENAGMSELQIEFIKALDQIMLRAAEEENVYIFVLGFFLEGFTEMGLSIVTDYLSELPHFQAECMGVASMMRIEQLVEPFRKIQFGAVAPPIIGNDLTDKPFSLDQIESKHTIIVFWSIHCPFCLELLPKLKILKRQHPEIEIVSVIIGKQNEDVKDFIEQEKLDWIHIWDGLNWDSPNATEYKVYGTPTIFLLNEKHQIIAKPMTYPDLEKSLNN